MSEQTLDEKELVDRKAFYVRASIYTAIAVLAAGGALIVAFILTGASGDVIFRSVVTLALLTAFAFAALGESFSAWAREGWLTLVRISLLLLTLAAGVWHVWSPVDLDGESSNYNVSASEFVFRTFLFTLTVGVLQLAGLAFLILEKRIKAKRITGPFLSVLAAGVIAFSIAMLMAALGFTFPHYFFDLEEYWRVFASLAVASTILIIIPFIARALNPDNRPQQSTVTQAPAQQPPAISPQRIPTKNYSPGWYPTSDGVMERFWDGTAWTAYTRPSGFDDEAPPSADTRRDS